MLALVHANTIPAPILNHFIHFYQTSFTLETVLERFELLHQILIHYNKTVTVRISQ